jgi:hypothetical protein
MTNEHRIQTLRQLLQVLTGSMKPRPSEKDLLLQRGREMISELERDQCAAVKAEMDRHFGRPLTKP